MLFSEITEQYFHEKDEQSLAHQGLHTCPCDDCESGLVYPTAWEACGESDWQVDLRCPDCEWTGSGVFSQEEVELFDYELDRGTEVLIQDYIKLSRHNMETYVNRFVTALETELILPEDF
jgi:hypothetical protein